MDSDAAPPPTSAPVAAGARATGAPARAPREAWPDNLRIFLISGVIVAHTSTAYVVDVSWYYEQRTTSELAATILSFPILLGALFGLGPLFVLAGWLSARTLARRGAGVFVGGRLVRLGVPLLAFLFLIDPFTDWLGKRFAAAPPTLADALLNRTGTRDMGPLWFVAALLVFSLVYATWRTVRRTSPLTAEHRPEPTGRTLLVAGAVVALASFAVWLRWPHMASTPINANWPHWPQAATMFTLGVLAGERGWLEDLPWARARRLGWIGALGAVALAALAGWTLATADVAVLTGGPTWQAAALAALDGVIAVTWVWWLLALFRRRWNAQRPWAVKAGRGSYAAFLLHPIVLVLLSLAFHGLAWPAQVKFLLVAAAAVPLTFLVGYGVTRIPGVRRIV